MNLENGVLSQGELSQYYSGWDVLKSCVGVSNLPNVAISIERPAPFPVEHKCERLLLMSGSSHQY